MEMQTHSQDILAYQITAGTVTELSQQTELTDLLPSSRQALQQLAPRCSTKDLQQGQLEDNTTGPIAGKTDLPSQMDWCIVCGKHRLEIPLCGNCYCQRSKERKCCTSYTTLPLLGIQGLQKPCKESSRGITGLVSTVVQKLWCS